MIALYHEIESLNNHRIWITGTLMLKLRGIKVGRKPHDLDILTNTHAPELRMPARAVEVPKSKSSNGTGIKYQIDGILVDVMSCGEKPVFFNGVHLSTIEDLIRIKENFASQNNKGAKKHAKDLIEIRRQLK